MAYKVGITIAILQNGYSRPREVKKFAQIHRAGKGQAEQVGSKSPAFSITSDYSMATWYLSRYGSMKLVLQWISP